tara:strand:- start:320 stop:475 length:156 start_codon:yes stop_codon:yes gene_type:complete
MDSEEILQRIKKHYLFFEMIEDKVENKQILYEAKKYMELLFFEIFKNQAKL